MEDDNIPDLLEIAIVKGKKVLVLVVQALYVVSDTLREVPDISSFKNFGSEATVLVDTGK